MTWTKDKNVLLKDLFIDRKMIAILAVFFILGIFLVCTVIVATNTISSLRAFSTMQTYWLEARKDATFELIHFVHTGDELHYEKFNESLQLIHDAHDLRVEFTKDSPDYDLVRELMERIHVNPKDIPSMIVTYERLHTFTHLSDAVRVWDEADQIIQELIDLSLEIHDQIGKGGFNMLLAPAERGMVQAHVSEVLKGNPADFETVWEKNDGDLITVHLTMLPIYVDTFIEGVFVIAEDISYQKYAEEKIKKQLEEKIYLLSEIHDRVKNNLALMSSLLQLQISFIDDSEAQQYLKSTISRIHSIAMVHEKLYQTDNFANIRMDDFIQELLAQIQKRYYRNSDNVQVEIDVDPVTLDIKQAVPSGLILNELIMNSYKFAFNGKKNGKLSISFNKEGDHVKANVSDNGIGLPKDFDINANSSLGMTLIKTLTKQLKAEMQIQNETGTSISFSFESRKSSKI